MTVPRRIQRRRTKGWRMPEGAMSVARPSLWGNPCVVGRDGDARLCVVNFHRHMLGVLLVEPDRLDDLRGKDLACWCAEDAEHCHADVLIELANRPREDADHPAETPTP